MPRGPMQRSSPSGAHRLTSVRVHRWLKVSPAACAPRFAESGVRAVLRWRPLCRLGGSSDLVKLLSGGERSSAGLPVERVGFLHREPAAPGGLGSGGGLAMRFAFADDLALVVRSIRLLPQIRRTLEAFGAATGLKVRCTKCAIVPLRRVVPVETDNVEQYRRWVAAMCPEWAEMKIATSHKYLGVEVGAGVSLDARWGAAIKKVREGVASVAAAGVSHRASAVVRGASGAANAASGQPLQHGY